MELNPNCFKSLNTTDLLARADELQRRDSMTATLLRWAALEIDSLRDAVLEAHGVTIIDRPCCMDPANAFAVQVVIIETQPDPEYGHMFKMPKPVTDV